MTIKTEAHISDEARLFELFDESGEKIVEVYPQLKMLSEGQLNAFAVYATDLLETGKMSAVETLTALNEALDEALDEYAIDLAARSEVLENTEALPTPDVSQEHERLHLTLEALKPTTTDVSVVPNTVNVRRVELPYQRHPMSSLKATVLRALAFTQ